MARRARRALAGVILTAVLSVPLGASASASEEAGSLDHGGPEWGPLPPVVATPPPVVATPPAAPGTPPAPADPPDPADARPVEPPGDGSPSTPGVPRGEEGGSGVALPGPPDELPGDPARGPGGEPDADPLLGASFRALRPLPDARVVVSDATIAALAREAEHALRIRAAGRVLRSLTPEHPGASVDLGYAEAASSSALGQLAHALAARTRADGLALLSEWQRTPGEQLLVLFHALAQVGKPVRYGQAGPSEYDSSGLTRAAWARVGVTLPHYSGLQLRRFPQVNVAHAAPGDVVVFGPDGGTDAGLVVGGGLMVIAAFDAPTVDVTTYLRPDLTAVVRPAGVIAEEHRFELGWRAPRPRSARAATSRLATEAIAPVATRALEALDASVVATVRREIARVQGQARGVLGPVIDRSEAGAGVPERLVLAYQRAAQTCAAPPDWWAVLAAIGQHESGHGTAGGSVVGPDGTASPPILGPRLDGSGLGGNTTPVADTDDGLYDGDRELDRAVGPMQLLPSTWARHATRAPERGPGIPDPQNVFDAIATAGRYLCAASGGEITDPRAAVYSYNRDPGYVESVLETARAIAGRRVALGPSATAPAAPTPDLGPLTEDVRRTRAELSAAAGALATEVARRFDVDASALLDEWRFAPVGALRAVLRALAATAGDAGAPGDLVADAWAGSGIALPREVSALAAVAMRIDPGELRPGDLVLFGLGGGDTVGLYVGAGIMAIATGRGGGAQLDGYDPVGLARFGRVPEPPPVLGGLGWLRRPVDGPEVSGFGLRRDPFHGDVRHHDGLDIAAPEGAPVRASAPGVVVGVGWLGGYGNVVEIDHGNGLTTLSAHLSAVVVEVGRLVRGGDVVARVGSTGASTGPHLHFEVRIRGVPVDPRAYLLPRLGAR